MAENLAAQPALPLRCLQHILVNVQRHLLLEDHVRNLDALSLADAHSPPNRLVHERSRPPRRQEDNLTEVLQIEAHAATVQLQKEDAMLAILERLVARALNHRLLLLHPHAPVILVDGLNRRALAQIGLEDVDLVVKLAEDDPPCTGRGSLDLVAESHELGAVPLPVAAAVGRIVLFDGVDIHLRVQGDLAKAHEEKEAHLCAAGVVLESAPAADDGALNALVELLLFLRDEVELLVLDDWRIGQLFQDGAHLLHRAVKDCLLRDLQRLHDRAHLVLGVTHEQEERVDVAERINDRSCRNSPAVRAVRCRLEHLRGERRVAVADTVSLIKDYAVKGATDKELLAVKELVVVGDVEGLGGIREEWLGALPVIGLALRPRGWQRDVDARLDSGLPPLLKDRLRREEKSVLHGRRILDETEHLHRLAEAHLVTDEAAASLGALLARHHPPHTIDLVRLVGKAIPQGGKFAGLSHRE